MCIGCMREIPTSVDGVRVTLYPLREGQTHEETKPDDEQVT